MPHVSRILIYPVKSLEAVSVDRSLVLPTGALADDRRFAIVDSSGLYVNGKRNSKVHLLKSDFDPTTRIVTLAHRDDHDAASFNTQSDSESLNSWLSDFFEQTVTFKENLRSGFPDDIDSPGPTVISVATLNLIAEWFDFTLEDARARFRANLEIDGVPPFWEDQLFSVRGTAVQFSIGDVVFDGINPCQRCIVPARDQKTGANISDFAKKFVELRRRYFPKWAEPSRFNHYYRLAINTRLVKDPTGRGIGVGDEIKIIGVTGEPEAPPEPLTTAVRPTRWSGTLRVARIYDNTPTVRTIRLASPVYGDLPFIYLPGQFLSVNVDIDGVSHTRCYTMASTPSRSGYCEFTIKREDYGAVSRYFHDRLKEGDLLYVTGPGGKFTFTGTEADSLLLIGAGVGITPLMSKIRYLTDQQWQGRIRLLYCVKSEKEIIFRNELENLAAEFPNLRLNITLTQDAGPSWRGLRGRITREQLLRALPQEASRRIHICGPTAMADDISVMLADIGVPPEQIKVEAFGGPNAAKKSTSISMIAGETVGTVTFADSGKSAIARSGQSLLEVGTLAGIAIDRGCLEGICGRCKVRVLSGDVTMDVNDALTASQIDEGYVLTCQTRPNGYTVLDI